MLIRIPNDVKRAVKSARVNCDPWSVLKISGVARRSASSRASRQNAVSSVTDTAQLTTYRLYQSKIATR